MFECDISLERMDQCLHKVYALFGVRQRGAEHLALPNLSRSTAFLPLHPTQVLLHDLELLRGHSDSTAVDGAADVVDEPRVGA